MIREGKLSSAEHDTSASQPERERESVKQVTVTEENRKGAALSL